MSLHYLSHGHWSRDPQFEKVISSERVYARLAFESMYVHVWPHLWSFFVYVQSMRICIYVKKKIEKEKKNNKRMCVVFSIIECVYWCSRVTLLSMFVDGSSYVSFLRPIILCIHFVVYFESEMSDLLLGALGHCHFRHYVHCWCDFISCLILRGSSLVYVFFASPSSSFLFFIHLICLTSCSFFFLYIATYSLFDTSFASSLHISLSVQFSSLPLYWYYIHIRPP